MWFALSMILLFVAYCWYDSVRMPLLSGAGWSNESDDDAPDLTELREMLDQPLKSGPERALAWTQMDFMTPDDMPLSTSMDGESTSGCR